MPILQKKIWIILFKALVLLGSYGFIAYRLGFDPTLRNQLLNGELSTNSTIWLLLAFFMMPLNWSLEAIKWQILLRPLEKTSFRKAFIGVLAGIGVAIFTPNRTGEYLGRIWVLKHKNRPAGVSITIAGSLAQSTVTFIVGVIAGWYWLTEVSKPGLTNLNQMVLASISTLLIIVVYFMLPQIANFLLKYNWKKIIKSALDGVGSLRIKHQYSALIISILRYAVFTTQFIILLHYFQCEMQLIESIVAIGMLYAAMLIIPSITVAEPGIRGSLSLLIFSVFSENEAGILAASLTLWIINLA
ncbi:MAG: hypothetical protein C0599_10400, partial [Salinivirgaceae bacterium]